MITRISDVYIFNSSRKNNMTKKSADSSAHWPDRILSSSFVREKFSNRPGISLGPRFAQFIATRGLSGNYHIDIRIEKYWNGKSKTEKVFSSGGLASSTMPDLESAIRKLWELEKTRVAVHGYELDVDSTEYPNGVTKVAKKFGITCG
jgi:hypothetical protein